MLPPQARQDAHLTDDQLRALAAAHHQHHHAFHDVSSALSGHNPLGSSSATDSAFACRL